MGQRNTFSRSLHDLGLAAWFGGSLMGAVGLDGAAAKLDDPSDRSRVVTTGWGRWGPVNAIAVASYLTGVVQLSRANKVRLAGQRGVCSVTGVKAGLTGLALLTSGYITWEGLKAAESELPARGDERSASAERDRAGAATRHAADRTSATSGEAGQARTVLRTAGWAVPALTGALVVIAAYQGEQQRPAQVFGGMLKAAPGRAATAAKAARAARHIPPGKAAKAGKVAVKRQFK